MCDEAISLKFFPNVFLQNFKTVAQLRVEVHFLEIEILDVSIRPVLHKSGNPVTYTCVYRFLCCM